MSTWTSSSSDVLSVNGSGLATAGRVGQGLVSARYNQGEATRVISVMTADTWRVSGSVSDGALGIAGAKVEVIDGVGIGTATLTNSYGNYILYGVGSAVTLRASAEGFHSKDSVRTFSKHTDSVSFTLDPSSRGRDLSGDWTLTFEAAADCATLFEAARVRSYRAAIAQTGASLRVVLSGANFVMDPIFPETPQNSFLGRILGDSLTITLTQDAYGRFDVAEKVGLNEIYTVVGTGSGVFQSGTAMTGTFAGTIGGDTSGMWRACNRQTHRFSLER
jgi:hypothetical protein